MPPLTFHPRRARGVLAATLAAGLAGVAATPAVAADGLRPSLQLLSTGTGSGIGDFNGDGLGDVIAGGKVVFGTRTPATVDLAQPLGSRGLTLKPVAAGSGTPGASPVGDLDADGFDDIAVPAGSGSVAVYIVYGAAGNADVELKAGPRVGTISSPNAGMVSRLGDWDGDGFDDLTITRNFGNSYGGTSTNVNQGVAVIRGGAARITSLNALTAGPRVQPITAAANCQLMAQFFWLRFGCAWRFQNASSVGDFDGDGKADLWVRTQDRTFVLRGRASTAPIDALRPTDLIEVQPASTTGPLSVVSAIPLGDLNADGRADFVTVSNIDELNRVILGRAGSAPIALGAADVTVSRADAIGPAGDVNGDGRDDVTLFSYGDQTPRYLTDLASRGPRVDAADATAIPGFSTPGGAPVGDFDGDGKDDLLHGTQLLRWGPTGGTADGFAPQLSLSVERNHTVGNDIDVSVSLNEAASVRFEITDEAGATTYGSFTREIASGQQTVRWTPKAADGRPLGAGIYRLRAVATDAAGNASDVARTDWFSIRAASASSVRANLTVQFPDGQPLASPVSNSWTVTCQAATGEVVSGANVELPGSSSAEIAGGEPGRTCWISIGPPVNVTEVTGCTWSTVATRDGATLPLRTIPNAQPRHEFTLAAGVNTIDVKAICAGGVRVGEVVPPFSAGDSAWRALGSSIPPRQGTNGWRLTPAQVGHTAMLASSQVVTPSGYRYSFTAQATAGNGAAEGLAIAFLPESSPVKVGAGGGGLGVGGTGATVVAFDMNKGPSDPGEQFIGISDSTMTDGHLNYAQTALAGHRMRGSAFKVDVVHRNGVLTVSTNGVVRLTRTMALPARARVVFTAATGARIHQEHLVSGLTMTRP